MHNYLPIATMLNKINVEKKSISTFDCNILYTTILRKLLLKVVSEVINFFFKSKVRNRKDFSKTPVYCTSKMLKEKNFIKQTIFSAISFLINTCLYMSNKKNIIVSKFILCLLMKSCEKIPPIFTRKY